MMSALIIGGDRLGRITEELHKKGFTDIKHITGRKGGERKIRIYSQMEKADLTIVLVDYVNHVIVNNLKNKINKNNKCNNVIYAKRSWSHMEKCINSFMTHKNEN